MNGKSELLETSTRWKQMRIPCEKKDEISPVYLPSLHSKLTASQLPVWQHWIPIGRQRQEMEQKDVDFRVMLARRLVKDHSETIEVLHYNLVLCFDLRYEVSITVWKTPSPLASIFHVSNYWVMQFSNTLRRSRASFNTVTVTRICEIQFYFRKHSTAVQHLASVTAALPFSIVLVFRNWLMV